MLIRTPYSLAYYSESSLSMSLHVETYHQFYFETEAPITAAMLAESLNGLQGIVKRSTDVISKLLNISIKDADVLITSIELVSC